MGRIIQTFKRKSRYRKSKMSKQRKRNARGNIKRCPKCGRFL